MTYSNEEIKRILKERSHSERVANNGNIHKLNGYGKEADSLGEWDVGEDEELWGHIPPREWLLGNVFCRGFVSTLLAAGGVGKTAIRTAQLISLATGRPLTGEHVFQRCRVLIVSLEDTARELRRRIRAACIYHNVTREEISGWLFVVSLKSQDGKLVVLDEFRRPVTGSLVDKLSKAIETRRIDIISLDPFVKSHSVEENHNSAIDQVVQTLTDMADKYDIAVDTPHHISKGTADPGNADRGRGASAAKDAFRLVYTGSPMSPEEADGMGIKEEERISLIRVDSGKVNIVPRMASSKWFRLVGVQLGNSTDLYPSGDDVQTVEPWLPPSLWATISGHDANAILTKIAGGMGDGQRYSARPRADSRAAWRVVTEMKPELTQGQARDVVKAWIKSGLLFEEEYHDTGSRKNVFGLSVNDSKRPECG